MCDDEWPHIKDPNRSQVVPKDIAAVVAVIAAIVVVIVLYYLEK